MARTDKCYKWNVAESHTQWFEIFNPTHTRIRNSFGWILARQSPCRLCKFSTMKKMRALIDGASYKPSTKSGHISDVEFEPQPPMLVMKRMNSLDLAAQDKRPRCCARRPIWFIYFADRLLRLPSTVHSKLQFDIRAWFCSKTMKYPTTKMS